MAPGASPRARWFWLSLVGLLQFCGAAGQAATVQASALVAPTLDHTVHLDRIAVVDVPRPQVDAGTVLVSVAASSVNPVDWKRPFLFPSPDWTYPHVLLLDFAGQVIEVGDGCHRLAPGFRVWGMADGAAAEVVAVPCQNVGVAPPNVPLEELAVLPLVALTGLQGFRWAGGAELAGKTVLVLGGSGGTGHTGIQLAKAYGAAKVIATCSASNADFVKSVGADEVIDYNAVLWYEALAKESLDMVYDTVCEEGTGDHAYPLLKEGGRFATLLPSAVASDATAAARPGVQQSFFMLNQTSYQELDILRGFVDAGMLHAKVSAMYTLDEVPTALKKSIAGHVVGKVAVLVAPSPALGEALLV